LCKGVKLLEPIEPEVQLNKAARNLTIFPDLKSKLNQIQPQQKLQQPQQNLEQKLTQLQKVLTDKLHRSKRKMRQNKWLKENNIIYIS
jgi:hypothetical protein